MLILFLILSIPIGLALMGKIDKDMLEEQKDLESRGVSQEEAKRLARSRPGQLGLTRGQCHDYGMLVILLTWIVLIALAIHAMTALIRGPNN